MLCLDILKFFSDTFPHIFFICLHLSIGLIEAKYHHSYFITKAESYNTKMPKSHRVEKPGLRTKLLTPSGLSVYAMHNESVSVSDWYVYARKQSHYPCYY